MINRNRIIQNTHIKHSKKTKKRAVFSNFNSRQILTAILLFVVFMGTSIGYVWSNFEYTQIGYNLSQLQQEELRLLEVNRKLKLELAMLRAPQNIEPKAVNELYMKPPTPDQIIVLK